MSIIEKLLNIGVGSSEKTGQAGSGKSVGKTGGKSVLFGLTLAKLGNENVKDASEGSGNEVGFKKVKLSRGGLEVEISYPKSLLEKKGSSQSGKTLHDPAVIQGVSEKKNGLLMQSDKKEAGSTAGVIGVEKSDKKETAPSEMTSPKISEHVPVNIYEPKGNPQAVSPDDVKVKTQTVIKGAGKKNSTQVSVTEPLTGNKIESKVTEPNHNIPSSKTVPVLEPGNKTVTEDWKGAGKKNSTQISVTEPLTENKIESKVTEPNHNTPSSKTVPVLEPGNEIVAEGWKSAGKKNSTQVSVKQTLTENKIDQKVTHLNDKTSSSKTAPALRSSGGIAPKDRKAVDSNMTDTPGSNENHNQQGKPEKITADIQSSLVAPGISHTVNLNGSAHQEENLSKNDTAGTLKSLKNQHTQVKTAVQQVDNVTKDVAPEQIKVTGGDSNQSKPNKVPDTVKIELTSLDGKQGQLGMEPKKLEAGMPVEFTGGKKSGAVTGKSPTVKNSSETPQVIRDRYYGQRIVKNSIKATDVPTDKVEINISNNKPNLHNSHGISSDGQTGSIESKSVNSPFSMGGNKQHTGYGSHGSNDYAPDQSTPATQKVKLEDTSPNIISSDNKTVSRSQATQGGNSTAPPAPAVQVNVPNVLAERLVSMVQKMPQTSQEQQIWHKHRLVMDNGQTLNVSAKTTDGVLHLQLSGGNQELNKLLQQHLPEIQNHLQEQMHVQIDLQFHNGANGQSAQQFQQQAGNRGPVNRFPNLSNELDERTAELSERPLSNRRLGYNNAEWTA